MPGHHGCGCGLIVLSFVVLWVKSFTDTESLAVAASLSMFFSVVCSRRYDSINTSQAGIGKKLSTARVIHYPEGHATP